MDQQDVEEVVEDGNHHQPPPSPSPIITTTTTPTTPTPTYELFPTTTVDVEDGHQHLTREEAILRWAPLSPQNLEHKTNQVIALLAPRASSSSSPQPPSPQQQNPSWVVPPTPNSQMAMHIKGLAQLLIAGCSPKTMRCLTQLIAQHCPSAPTTTAFLPNLLRTIREAASCPLKGPSKVFCFSGKGSYLSLDPHLESWGDSLGGKTGFWGIALWMWVGSEDEAFSFCRFMTPQRHGVSVTMVLDKDAGLTVLFESAEDRNRASAAIKIPKNFFKPRTWHFVSLTHSRGRRFGSSAEVKIRVDDKDIPGSSHPLLFPAPTITPINSTSSRIVNARLLQDFQGLTSAIWIFHAPCSRTQLANLARALISPIMGDGEPSSLGSSLGILNNNLQNNVVGGVASSTLSSSSSTATSHPSSTQLSTTTTTTMTTGANITSTTTTTTSNPTEGLSYSSLPVWAMYHPDMALSSSSSHTTIDNTNRRIFDLFPGRRDCHLFNSFTWVVQSVKDAVRHVGGMEQLLPLVLYSSNHSDSPACILESIRLLTSLLEGHTSNQRNFLQCGGPRKLAYLLETLDNVVAHKLMDTDHLLFAMNLLTRAVSYELVATVDPRLGVGLRFVRSMGEVAELERECDAVFSLNFDLWCSLGGLQSGHSTIRVAGLAAKRVEERPVTFKKKFGVRGVFDALRKMYVRVLSAPDHVEALQHARRVGAFVVDKVLIPMLSGNGGGKEMVGPITKEDVRAIVDACVSASLEKRAFSVSAASNNTFHAVACGSGSMEVCHDALRLLIRLFVDEEVELGTAILKHCGDRLIPILIVETASPPNLPSRIRALALRCVSVILGFSGVDATERFAQLGCFSYLGRALAHGKTSGGGGKQQLESSPSSTLASSSSSVGARIGESVGGALKSIFVSSHPPSRMFSPHPQSSPQHSPPATPRGATTSSSQKRSSPNMFQASPFDVAPTTTTTTTSLLADQQHPVMCESTYNALLGLTLFSSGCRFNAVGEWNKLVKEILQDDDVDLAFVDGQPPPPIILDDTSLIKNPYSLGVLLEQLPHMSTYFIQKTLQDLFVLLKYEPLNRRALASLEFWQTSLASFLLTEAGKRDGIQDLVVRLWSLVLGDVLQIPTLAGTVVDELVSFAHSVPESCVLSSLQLVAKSKHASYPSNVLDALVFLVYHTGGQSETIRNELFDVIDGLARDEDLSPWALCNLVLMSIESLSGDNAKSTTHLQRCTRLMSHSSLSVIKQNAETAMKANKQDTSLDTLKEIYLVAVICVAKIHGNLGRLRLNAKSTTPSHEPTEELLLALANLAQECSQFAFPGTAAVQVFRDMVSPLQDTVASPLRAAMAWMTSPWAKASLKLDLPGTMQEMESMSDHLRKERIMAHFSREQERSLRVARARAELEERVKEHEERAAHAEFTRIHNNETLYREEKRMDGHVWVEFLKSITSQETSMWWSGRLIVGGDDDVNIAKNHRDGFIRWKYSEREDVLRRHLVLERNLDWVSHANAAYADTLKGGGGSSPALPRATPTTPTPTQSSSPIIVMATEHTPPFSLGPNESVVHVVEGGKHVTPSRVLDGRIEVTSWHVCFYAETRQRLRWRLDELVELHSRRYLLRKTALELFFMDQTTCFLAFPTMGLRDETAAVLLKLKPARLEKAFTGTLAPPSMVLKASRWTELWRKRQISNFEYLMRLNTIAGRTYNDVTQYFVFPWVLADYESKELDFNKVATFRDLRQPMGALVPSRREEVINKYQEFADADMGMPPFHYGSHYSSAGVVLHYLLRVEPYTSLAIELQGGRFDVPDRLFHSVADSFRSVTSVSSSADVRELIPEFFYSPRMFQNRDGLPLGRRQGAADGIDIDDVVLPPWANHDAELFIRLNRAALESEYVSQNLNHWIDLIFGYKQRGPAAQSAVNVFHYLCYEGAVDLDAIEDLGKRKAIESQILEFGQCPSQLMFTAHPSRLPQDVCDSFVVRELVNEARLKFDYTPSTRILARRREGIWNPLLNGATWWEGDRNGASAAAVVVTGNSGGLLESLFGISGSGLKPKQVPPVVSVTCFQDRVVVVHQDMQASVHHIHLVPGKEFDLRMGVSMVLPSALSCCVRFPTSSHFAVTHNGHMIASCPYVDGSIKAARLDATRTDVSAVSHRAPITCMCSSHDGRFLVSGARDGSITVWSVGGTHDVKDEMLDLFTPSSASTHFPLLRIMHHITGHSSEILALCATSELGLIASSSMEEKAILMHNLRDGFFLRRFPFPDGGAATLLQFAPGSGLLIAYSSESNDFDTFTVNGAHLAHVDMAANEDLVFMVVTGWHEQEIVLTGTRNGDVIIRRADDLHATRRVAYAKKFGGARCACVSPEGKFVFVGCGDGSLMVLSELDGKQA